MNEQNSKDSNSPIPLECRARLREVNDINGYEVLAKDSNSKNYHLPNCPDYSEVAEHNAVGFKTEAEAQAAVYRKTRNYPQ